MFQKPLVSNKLYGMSNCLEIYQCIHYRWEKAEKSYETRSKIFLHFVKIIIMMVPVNVKINSLICIH